ncbi:hypothetical protein HD_0109 [[Haemophilus] ducreyi 35000HP]|uniref:Uncharacterized protein n=1 Tax=Haemophilus ducreyi (strain 35000HP / ATCC 700724) TaxID=233412 RepID=Q7VPG9_HAEDU|nr:hypothetical protein HD_0109 [[Haemophilus] ducreyi 35000HP]
MYFIRVLCINLFNAHSDPSRTMPDLCISIHMARILCVIFDRTLARLVAGERPCFERTLKPFALISSNTLSRSAMRISFVLCLPVNPLSMVRYVKSSMPSCCLAMWISWINLGFVNAYISTLNHFFQFFNVFARRFGVAFIFNLR